ncbi:sensor histidine kinase [Streptomyces sp. NPDC090119]|uniref:sensor histidine kinase n=1 Tax=Streptomyces sp. NPDC090119 TaxID=3365951 RepID=UPI00382FAB58
MSHLRAPAARADRREGGRHGRPVARPAPALPETLLRPQLMRLAVLPPVAVALAATAAVVFTARAHTGLALWAMLAAAVVVAGAAIAVAAVAADRAARSVGDRVGALRRNAARGEADLRALVDGLRRGDAPPRGKPRRRPPEDADDFELLAADLARAHDGAVTAVVRAAQLSSQAANEQKLEVFVNLARRLQSLVHREISILDELENEIEDPDLLKGLFHVDHLATRIRRHAENLAVLGGAVSRRQWSNPVDMTEVLRSAIAEVEQYSRVKLVPPIEGELRGHAVADVIHLLAELVENATVFSAPQTQVLLRANLVTSGLAIEVEDRGLGMPVEEQHRMNALLSDPDQVKVASLLADGRIGLYVVSQLARRHGISVRLQTNIYGGVQAVLVVPQGLLGASAGGEGAGAVAVPAPELAGPPAEAAGAVAAALSAPVPAPATGRHRQVARRGSGDAGAGTGAATPPPLPMRGAQEQRANPAEAVPGISAGDRAVVEAHTGALPTPRAGVAPTGTDRPQLPRRRAQEHIVPQLRGGPAPRQDSDLVVGHDPGLMAAFQRGVGLAESQQSLEDGGGSDGYGELQSSGEAVSSDTAYMEGTHTDTALMAADDMAAVPMEADHMGASHMDAGHLEVGHLEADHVDADHMAPGHMEVGHMEVDHTAPGHTAPSPTAPDHTQPGPMDRSSPPV